MIDRRRSSRTGYVLLLVLVTLMVASVSLVGLANTSLRKNTHALQATERLQTKWGRVSCERAVLLRADQVFEQMEQLRQEKPISSVVRQSVSLGNQRFDLLLADEDAKLPLARIAEVAGTAAAKLAIGANIPLRFTRETQLRPDANGRFTGWGQVFNIPLLATNHGGVRAVAEATKNVTLWSSGKINIHRSSDDVIRSLLSTQMPTGQANRFIQTLRESPRTEVAIILERTIQNEQEKAQLRELLGNGSSTYSLWTECLTLKGRRSLVFSVSRVDEQGIRTSSRFVVD